MRARTCALALRVVFKKRDRNRRVLEFKFACNDVCVKTRVTRVGYRKFETFIQQKMRQRLGRRADQFKFDCAESISGTFQY